MSEVWALIPIKGAGEGKSRLAGVLTAVQRTKLVDAMFRHVAAAVAQASAITRTMLLGPMRDGLDSETLVLDEPGDLNAALGKALARIVASPYRPDRLVVVAADLPCLAALDVGLLAGAPRRSMAIAPDRHGTGTNALSLPLPEAAGFRFQYGADSAALHAKEAERLGIAVETVLSPGLEKDIDAPSDLPDAVNVYNIADLIRSP